MSQLTGYEKAEIRGLRLQDQAWSLELTRLVPTGNGIFHSIAESIDGADEIVQTLEQVLGQPELAEQTRQLVGHPTADARRLYRLADRRWLPLPDASFTEQQLSPARRDSAALAASLASLRALRDEARAHGYRVGGHTGEAQHSADELLQRVEQLTATVRRLEARIEALERGQPVSAASTAAARDGLGQAETDAEATGPADAAAESADAAANAEADARVAPEVDRAPPAPEPFSLPAVDASANGDQQDEQREQQEAQSDQQDEAAPQAPPLGSLPALEDLQTTGEMLFGDDVSLAPADSADRPREGAYIATLIDDQDAVVGAVVSSVEAMVSLGGAMLMIPDNTWPELLKEPSKDIFDAMSEIVNNITPLLNKAEDNVHVRSNPMVLLDPAEHPWLDEGAQAVFRESALEGCFAVIAAPRVIS
jgi:hypothetical protein